MTDQTDRQTDTGTTFETIEDEVVETPDAPDEAYGQITTEDPETFPRAYVTQLREEAAKYRTRAQRADDLAQRLHGALVAATGRLADPTDLAYDETHVDDADALTAAIDDLLARKPHLASRRPVGDVGQGAAQGDNPVDLAGMLRRNAS